MIRKDITRKEINQLMPICNILVVYPREACVGHNNTRKPEVEEWLLTNVGNHLDFGWGTKTGHIRFENEEDAMAFKLRWI